MRKESIEIGSVFKVMNMHAVCVARNIIIKIVCKYPGFSNTAFIFQMWEFSHFDKDNKPEVQYLELTIPGAHFRKIQFYVCWGNKTDIEKWLQGYQEDSMPTSSHNWIFMCWLVPGLPSLKLY